jgi:hypothetical protein
LDQKFSLSKLKNKKMPFDFFILSKFLGLRIIFFEENVAGENSDSQKSITNDTSSSSGPDDKYKSNQEIILFICGIIIMLILFGPTPHPQFPPTS